MSIYPEHNGMKFYCAATFHCSECLLVASDVRNKSQNLDMF